MREALGHLLRFLVSLALVALVAFFAEIRLDQEVETGVLRLALRTTAGRVEICRDRSAEELEALPRHMRKARVCEWHNVPFRLTATLGEAVLVDRRVVASGDRPLVTDEQVHLPPGPGTLRVRLVPEPDEDDSAAVLAQVPSFELTEDVVLRAGRIHLVTLDDNFGRLRLDRPSP